MLKLIDKANGSGFSNHVQLKFEIVRNIKTITTKEFSKCTRITSNHNKCKHLSLSPNTKQKNSKQGHNPCKKNWVSNYQFEFWFLTTLLITIWALNIQMKNVNPFSIFRLQYLLNGFKRTQFSHFLLFAFLSQKNLTLWNFRFPKVKVGRLFEVLSFTFPLLWKCVWVEEHFPNLLPSYVLAKL
jgi:hypothetical protein